MLVAVVALVVAVHYMTYDGEGGASFAIVWLFVVAPTGLPVLTGLPENLDATAACAAWPAIVGVQCVIVYAIAQAVSRWQTRRRRPG